MNNLQKEIKCEIWKDIAGFEGYYQISNLGRVKSLKRYHKNSDSIMSCPKDGSGYHTANLNKSGNSKRYGVHTVKRRTIRVHRLVASMFLENKNNLACVNHKDGNKLNNHVDNLEWASKLENETHALKTGLLDKRDCSRKLNEKQVRVIKWLKIINPKRSDKEIGKFFNVSGFAITDILKGKTWKHVKI